MGGIQGKEVPFKGLGVGMINGQMG